MRRRNKGLPQFFEDLQKYCPDEVAKIKEEDGENAVIYGIKCYKNIYFKKIIKILKIY